ncbi:hydrolase 1, exosortase A system-associated [Alteraurantiacibacter aquimixticola]|uniref:Hydrolase 1, exosortase A system-associated n=1 Tax=Alteraurantiacibacter aquimixticola TaxID=2489173 RepID=A0A4T3F113_9SPHN|nr:hydrolase 1, exosortase A system-associated [Alteraurantiacibacter aquimixticola]TIX49955.1 hydrolase 1, exosortase A system-associated [Alteraurantiacibacter aquimixticola]
MTREHFVFECEGEQLHATLDDAPGKTGLLIVSGGNETRAGAFSGHAHLAAEIAAEGYPVLRFDRRGVGDSSGENAGFTGSAPDIRAAVATLRNRRPDLARIVGFGNCDAASALMLGDGCGLDALVLANVWTFDGNDSGHAPEALRARYASKLRNPAELARLFRGEVSIDGLLRGLKSALSPAPAATSLCGSLRRFTAAPPVPTHYLVAEKDRTGQAFLSAFPELREASHVCKNAGHSFPEPHARAWLREKILSALHEQARQLDMG